jgi:hypothetical protein
MLSASATVGSATANSAKKITRLINRSSYLKSRLLGDTKKHCGENLRGPAVASSQPFASADYDYYLAYGLPKYMGRGAVENK